MKSQFHVSKRTGKKVYGAAHIMHEIKQQGGIDGYSENRREEGRSQVMKEFRSYFKEVEMLEQKLNYMMEQSNIKYIPNLYIVNKKG